MKKKIFITGISSLLMKNLSKLIDLSKYEIIGLTQDAKALSFKNIRLIEGDILDINQYREYIVGSEFVIHAAAVTHSYNENKYYQINYEATKKIVDLVNKINIKRFIYISSNTASINGGAYAKSKLLAEQYIQSNLPSWSVFRISEIYDGGYNKGIDQLIKNALRSHFALCPIGMEYKFSPIHVIDSVNILHDAIFNLQMKNEIININGNEKYSINEILNYIKNKKNSPLKIIFIKQKTMYFLLRVIKFIPFYIGIIPDQIERLYGYKSYQSENKKIKYNLKQYINSL